jgi:predicted GIY-YIG superfamily endonuclease
MSAFLYILRCFDGSYYVGTTRGRLEARIAEHQAGIFDGYTARRRPVVLVFHQEFARIEEAIAAERQVKGWRREKKEGLSEVILRRYPTCRDALHRRLCVLRDGVLRPPPQHEETSYRPQKHNVPHTHERRLS